MQSPAGDSRLGAPETRLVPAPLLAAPLVTGHKPAPTLLKRQGVQAGALSSILPANSGAHGAAALPVNTMGAPSDISDAECHTSDPPENSIIPVLRANSGDWLASLSPTIVSGGLCDALAVNKPAHSGYYVRIFERSSGIGSGGFSVNSQRQVHTGWRSACVRRNSKHVNSRGIITLWRKGDFYMVAYRDGPAVARWLGEITGLNGQGISPHLWGAMMHALEGNTDTDFQLLVWRDRNAALRLICDTRRGLFTDELFDRMVASAQRIVDDAPPPGPLNDRGVIAPKCAYHWAVSHEDANQKKHSENGNVNRFAPLAGYSAEVAANIGESMEDLADVIVDQPQDDTPEPSDDGQSEADTPIPGERRIFSDELSLGVIENYGRPWLMAYAEFERDPSSANATKFNSAHSKIDECGNQDAGLRNGVRLITKMQPGEDEKKEKKKKKTKAATQAQKQRNGMRLRMWLGKMQPEVAETWVRNNKPDEACVPANSPYLHAYNTRMSRGDYYNNRPTEAYEEHDGAVSNVIHWFCDEQLPQGAEYLGPMSRALIQSLLQIGNIELHPGMPLVNNELASGYRWQNIEALRVIADVVDDELAGGVVAPVALVIIAIRPASARQHFGGNFVASPGTAVQFAAFDAVIPNAYNVLFAPSGLGQFTDFKYVIAREAYLLSQTSNIPGCPIQFSIDRNATHFSVVGQGLIGQTQDQLFAHKDLAARLTLVTKVTGVAGLPVVEQPTLSVFGVADEDSCEPRTRSCFEVSATTRYQLTGAYALVWHEGEFLSVPRTIFNKILRPVIGVSDSDALAAYFGRLKSMNELDPMLAGPLSAAVFDAGSRLTHGVVSSNVVSRGVYQASVAKLERGALKWFRTNVFDHHPVLNYLNGDRPVPWRAVWTAVTAAYGSFLLSKKFNHFHLPDVLLSCAYRCLADVFSRPYSFAISPFVTKESRQLFVASPIEDSSMRVLNCSVTQ